MRKVERMKLAEALILRADQQKRVGQLRHRLLRNAKVQEGDTPAEEPAALLREYEEVSQALLRLIQQINLTNSRTPALRGNLADAIAERDLLRARAQLYRDLAEAATVTQERAMRTEIKFRATLSVSEMQRVADGLSSAYREQDAAIQALNWTTELIEG